MATSLVKEILYKDFNSNFTPHPMTGDVSLVTNDKAISQSLRNLVLTGRYEIPYNSEKSGRVYESLFENFDPITLKVLEDDVRRVIQNFEPRAEVLSVVISQQEIDYINKKGRTPGSSSDQYSNMLDKNTIVITVVYRPINNKEPVNLEILVEKVR